MENSVRIPESVYRDTTMKSSGKKNKSEQKDDFLTLLDGIAKPSNKFDTSDKVVGDKTDNSSEKEDSCKAETGQLVTDAIDLDRLSVIFNGAILTPSITAQDQVTEVAQEVLVGVNPPITDDSVAKGDTANLHSNTLMATSNIVADASEIVGLNNAIHLTSNEEAIPVKSLQQEVIKPETAQQTLSKPEVVHTTTKPEVQQQIVTKPDIQQQNSETQRSTTTQLETQQNITKTVLAEQNQSESDLNSNDSQSDTKEMSKELNALQMHTDSTVKTAIPEGDEVVHVKVGDGAELNAGELAQKLAEKIAIKAAANNREFEIQLEPQNLGKITIKIAFGQDGTTVSMTCNNSKTLGVLSECAKEISSIIQSNIGNSATVHVETPEDSYLNHQREDGGNNGQSQEQDSHNKKRHKEAESQDFLDQLRLGLVRI